MDKESKNFLGILARYFILLLSAFHNLAIFYLIFTPFTIYASYALLGLLFEVSLIEGNFILLGQSDILIQIIPACVAGAAYYLLFILNMSVGGVSILKRTSMILFALSSFFIVNVLRIFLMGTLYFYDFVFFDILHKILWYFGSVILTAGIWFLQVYLFKVESIPFYSDLKMIYKKSIFNKK